MKLVSTIALATERLSARALPLEIAHKTQLAKVENRFFFVAFAEVNCTGAGRSEITVHVVRQRTTTAIVQRDRSVFLNFSRVFLN